MSTATSDPRRPHDEAGFTLIEVLIAMIILAVGLLALEALGIAAATSVNNADQKSELTIAATDVMEATIQEVRRNPMTADSPQDCEVDAASGLYACTRVETRASVTGLTSRTARITVTISRAPDSAQRLTISSYVFDPQLPE